MIRNIFFDFDGVLAESVNVKTEAFRKLYLPFGEEVANKVVEHHLANGGVSRFEKVKHYHSAYLQQEIDEKQIQTLAQGFADLALQGVIDADEVNGAFEFLSNESANYKCWVITGTPTKEIKEILVAKNWEHFFVGAYGSPEKKSHWTEYLISEYQLDRNETVFIGDALADYEAARHSDLHFILRSNDDNKHLFEFYDGGQITDMTQLSKAIQSIQ